MSGYSQCHDKNYKRRKRHVVLSGVCFNYHWLTFFPVIQLPSRGADRTVREEAHAIPRQSSSTEQIGEPQGCSGHASGVKHSELPNQPLPKFQLHQTADVVAQLDIFRSTRRWNHPFRCQFHKFGVFVLSQKQERHHQTSTKNYVQNATVRMVPCLLQIYCTHIQCWPTKDLL